MTNPNLGGANAGADDLDVELREVSPEHKEEKKTTAIPDKYQGKSVDDLIEMHRNAERALSRQGNEVSELRRIADSIILSNQQNQNARKEAPKPVTVEALLDNPERVLNETLERSTVATRATAQEQRLDALEKKLTYQDFVSKHSDYQQDASDPQFLSWVQKNQLRTQLAQKADAHDYSAATALFDMWDEYKSLANVDDKKEQTQDKRREKLQRVRTTGNAANEGRVQPKYSRAKLMDLRDRVQNGDSAAKAKWDDPAFQADLILAYQEGRVK